MKALPVEEVNAIDLEYCVLIDSTCVCLLLVYFGLQAAYTKTLIKSGEIFSLSMQWTLFIIPVILLLIRVPLRYRKIMTLLRMQTLIIRHVAPIYYP